MPRESPVSVLTSGVARSTLINRNVTVGGRRTSIRLEPVMWQALAEIAEREAVSINDLCDLVNARRHESTLTAAIRVFILTYYQAASTEEGHLSAGHGQRRQDLTTPYRSPARSA